MLPGHTHSTVRKSCRATAVRARLHERRSTVSTRFNLHIHKTNHKDACRRCMCLTTVWVGNTLGILGCFLRGDRRSGFADDFSGEWRTSQRKHTLDQKLGPHNVRRLLIRRACKLYGRYCAP